MTECKVTAYRSANLMLPGEKRYVLPVEGSVDRKGETGTCPECLTPGVLLSVVGGFVRKHKVSSVAIPENNPQPATLVEAPTRKSGKSLSEAQVDVVDTGSQDGDPRDGMQRRVAEVDGAYQRGTVKVPRKGDKGRTKLTDVPANEANVREALAYWRSRKPRTDASRAKQNDMVSLLSRRLEAMLTGPVAMTAAESPEGFTQHMLSGPALVQGPNMAPVQKRWRNPVTGVSEVAAARLDGSLTERLDRTVADPKPVPQAPKAPKRTASQRKNWRRKQQRDALKREVAELKARLGE